MIKWRDERRTNYRKASAMTKPGGSRATTGRIRGKWITAARVLRETWSSAWDAGFLEEEATAGTRYGSRQPTVKIGCSGSGGKNENPDGRRRISGRGVARTTNRSVAWVWCGDAGAFAGCVGAWISIWARSGDMNLSGGRSNRHAQGFRGTLRAGGRPLAVRAITCQDLSRRRSSFLLKQKSNWKRITLLDCSF